MDQRVICGRYRLIRVLGKGGMGEVWLAEDGAPGAFVAVKLIHSKLAENPEVRNRFAREAYLASRLRHPNVARTLAHGEAEDGMPYIAMESLVGENLRERLTLRGRLPLPEVARILSHVSRGVAAAHEDGLVHRDLKPENIFLAHIGNDEVAKVLDFGVAKSIDALSMATFDPTITGALLGTPLYMSPEQARGLKSIDQRSDLWTLGVVVFECITGKLPFRASTLAQLVGLITTAPIPVPSRVAPDAEIPPSVDAWMVRALARAASDRFASVQELSADFLAATGVVDSREPTPWRVTSPGQTSEALSRQSLGLSATVAVTPSAQALAVRRSAPPESRGIVSAERRVAAPYPELRETLVSGPPPPRRGRLAAILGAVGVVIAVAAAALGIWMRR